MKKKQAKDVPLPQDTWDEDAALSDSIFSVASNCECTGLIPAAVQEDAQVDSYNEIYDIPLTKDDQKAIQDEQPKSRR